MVERTVRVIGKDPKRIFERTTIGAANAKRIRDQYLSEGVWMYQYELRYLLLHKDDIAKILIFNTDFAKKQKQAKPKSRAKKRLKNAK